MIVGITTVPESKLLEYLRDSIDGIEGNIAAVEAGIEEFSVGPVAAEWLALNRSDVIAISGELERRWSLHTELSSEQEQTRKESE